MRKLFVLSVVAVSLWTLSSTANPRRVAEDAESNDAVNAIADLLEKNEADAAKKAAAELAKKAPDVETVMHGFKTRKLKGIGVGNEPGVVTPDGIELKINALARDGITAAAIKKEGKALTRAGYVIQAIGLYATANAPEKNDGKKKRSDWLDWTEKMVKGSQEFVAAAKGGNAADLKKAASNIKNTCDACHAVFK
jgi:hypothetical protein